LLELLLHIPEYLWMDYSVCGLAKHLLLWNSVQHLTISLYLCTLTRKQLQDSWTYIHEVWYEQFYDNHWDSSNCCLDQTIATISLHEDYMYYLRRLEQNLLNMYHKEKIFPTYVLENNKTYFIVSTLFSECLNSFLDKQTNWTPCIYFPIFTFYSRHGSGSCVFFNYSCYQDKWVMNFTCI
jgi:hypothetical protein